MVYRPEVWIALLCAICGVTCVELEKGPVALVRPVPVQPQMPKLDCSQHFPGTPGWNDCFQTYMKEMADYQTKMQEYSQNLPKNEGTTSNFNGGSYSQSQSTSNSFVGGYAIMAINMGLSTSMSNGILKVTFNVGGPVDSFERKVEGNEIQFRVVSKGQQKLARIIVPKGISVEDVKLDKTVEAIYLTGPTNIAGSFSQMSQSSSSSSGTGFNQNFQFGTAGQTPMGEMPPMPDFQNMFQNMFQSFLPNLFAGINGGRAMPQQKPTGNQASYYPIPGIWFF